MTGVCVCVCVCVCVFCSTRHECCFQNVFSSFTKKNKLSVTEGQSDPSPLEGRKKRSLLSGETATGTQSRQLEPSRAASLSCGATLDASSSATVRACSEHKHFKPHDQNLMSFTAPHDTQPEFSTSYALQFALT